MSLLPNEIVEIRSQIRSYAKEYGLDFHEVIFEMVDADQMNSLAAFGGFPVRYPHWRFGMDYDQYSKGNEWGMQKIYEMVINTDPCYAYLLRSNPIVDQKMVISHVYGHADFFKNNYWFSKTNRRMLDTMANSAVRIRGYMEDYGQDVVEDFIDRCLCLENLIDAHLPFRPKAIKEEDKADLLKSVRKKEDFKFEESGKIHVDRSYMDAFINPREKVEERRKNIKKEKEEAQKAASSSAGGLEKDVLLYLLNHAPLQDWQYDVLSIVRDEAYYYLPQLQTKIMNEGWASYWHSKIMTEKALRDSEVLDFACNHSGAMRMSPGRINPYKVGIELFRDIEDRWNRGAFGKDYDECEDIRRKACWNTKLGKGREKIFEVRQVCNDLTFIDGYLTPEFVERYKLYTYEFNRRTNQYEIAERDYKKVKEKLVTMLTNAGQPFIYVKGGNYENRGELLLHHKHQGVDLDLQRAREVMSSLASIWSRPVNLETEVEGQKKILHCKVNGEFSDKQS